ncbi:TPA: type II toxin-antitoxin system antitoxin SocA domain-containing protein [Elizabethkingia anophelis]
MDKILNTKYILTKLIEWYSDSYGDAVSNDLSVLKTLKLIFLLSTINVDQKNKNLLDYNYRFTAMPYGPVEIDVYDWCKDGTLNEIIGKQGINTKELLKTDFTNIDSTIQNVIDNNIAILKSENYYLITKSASYLVDLTHEFDSWKKNYEKAIKQGKYSHEIPSSEIKQEHFYYSF